jgi:tripartite-type tricarboxylate transporter receptor subunit TctC
MKSTLKLIAAIALATAAATAGAAYPDKPIKIIVPASAGGAADTLARMVGKEISDKLGQPVVVDNRPGAAAIVGMTALAKAPADGYTFGLTFAGAMSINPSLYKGLPYDTTKDYDPISIVAVSPLVVGVNPSLGPKSLQDLVAMAKSRPGKLTFGSAGTGSTQHLSVELLKVTTGVDMMHVPYKGSPAALTDLVGGTISLMSDNAITMIPMFQTGRLVPLAVGTSKRISSLPDVPTIAESGYPGFEAVGWYGLVAPAGTDKAVVDSVNAIVRAAMAKPDFVAALRKQGMEPQANTPAEFRAYIQHEREKWAGVIKAAQIPAQDIR